MEINISKYKEYSPLILRISMSLVFLWFGISQLINPQSFLGYIPQWIFTHDPIMIHQHEFVFLHNLPALPYFLIVGNGVFEVFFGLILMLGFFTRISAFLLAVHLLAIAINQGYNDLMIRDMGLIIATFSIFLHGADKWTIDKKRKLKEYLFN